MKKCLMCGSPMKECTTTKVYRLLKDIPGLKAGAVFIHDKTDHYRGSIGCGCLKLAWHQHNCQQDWCAETHVFPGQLANDKEWFKPIKNNGEYSL